MSIGSWDPEAADHSTPFEFDNGLLAEIIALGQNAGYAEIAQIIPQDQLQKQSRMMTLGKEAWFQKAEDYNEADIIQLIRFFTLAEMKLPGWEAGAESPVVWLVKVLRKRGTPPDRDLLLWIKTNTTNKFLPNGAL